MNWERAGVCPERTWVPSPGPALGATVGSKDRRHQAEVRGRGGRCGAPLLWSGLQAQLGLLPSWVIASTPRLPLLESGVVTMA